MAIDYQKIYREAYDHARRQGYQNDAEDFAQDCCLYAFRKNDPSVGYKRRFVDYLRKNYGRTGNPGFALRQRAQVYREEYNDETHGAQPPDGPDDREVTNYLTKLSRYERIIYVLHHKFGVSLHQIADSQGVSDARISQVLKGIQKTINKDVKREISGLSRKRQEELEKVLREKREEMEQREDREVAQVESFPLESFDTESL